MPVITPAFPAMCATHSITPSTKEVMMEEFLRADKIAQEVFNGKESWSTLFQRHSFFTKDHKYYLSVVAMARDKDANDTFGGLVKSKVRLLQQGIDDGQTGIDLARPYIEGFERLHRCRTEQQVEETAKGGLEHMIPESEIPTARAAGDQVIYTTTFYIGLRLPQGMFSVWFRYVSRLTVYLERTTLDISYPTNQFRARITESDLFNDTMSVRVVHTRK